MERDFKVTIDVSGENVIITDSSNWGEEIGDRKDYALICGVFKFLKEGNFIPLTINDGSNQISWSPIFDNEEESNFSFKLGEDGYHKGVLVFAILDDFSIETEGIVVYQTSNNKLFIREDSSWVEKQIEDILLSENKIRSAEKDLGFNVRLEKKLSAIWNRYENNALPAKGEDFKNFYTGYGVLLGAISSLRQMAFAEYDRKIQLANKLVSRWK